jgi:hypothetical protein
MLDRGTRRADGGVDFQQRRLEQKIALGQRPGGEGGALVEAGGNGRTRPAAACSAARPSSDRAIADSSRHTRDRAALARPNRRKPMSLATASSAWVPVFVAVHVSYGSREILPV